VLKKDNGNIAIPDRTKAYRAFSLVGYGYISILTKEQEKQMVLNFNNEIKMYNKINKIYADIQAIHSKYLEVK